MPADERPTVIETSRLRLRPLRPDDLQDLHDVVFSDPAVTWDGSTGTLEDTRRALDAKLRHFEEHGFGMMAVVDRGDGALLGYAGLQWLEDGPDVEIGYYLGRRAWGRGLATELAHALVERAFGDLELTRLVAVVRPENEASKRVLAKAGLHPEGLAHHYGADVELWSMDAPPLT
jgi:[ribosomal protein S5]-alanine N-acetyltransferase